MLASHARERVRRLRLAKGLSQTEFGAQLGVSSGTVSKIENGRAEVADDQLASIAECLGCSPSFLLRADDVLPASRPWLRAYADASKKAVDREVASCITAVEAIEVLGARTLPDRIPVAEGDLADDDEIEAMAALVRSAAGIDEDGVCANTIRAAERLGCLVLPMGEELGRHLGMSMRADGIPIICASRPSENFDRHVPGDRQRFTIAHELGHLALHGDVAAPRNSVEAARIERQAHRFAGAFLAPADTIVEELDDLGGRVTLKTLAELKTRWGIAIKALVMRFQQLGVIDQDQARSLYKQISSRGWSKREPAETGNEAAVWLTKTLGKRATPGREALLDASESAGLSVEYFERWTDWSPTQDASVTVLPTARSGEREAGRRALVTDLASARRGRTPRHAATT